MEKYILELAQAAVFAAVAMIVFVAIIYLIDKKNNKKKVD